MVSTSGGRKRWRKGEREGEREREREGGREGEREGGSGVLSVWSVVVALST